MHIVKAYQITTRGTVGITFDIINDLMKCFMAWTAFPFPGIETASSHNPQHQKYEEKRGLFGK